MSPIPTLTLSTRVPIPPLPLTTLHWIPVPEDSSWGGYFSAAGVALFRSWAVVSARGDVVGV